MTEHIVDHGKIRITDCCQDVICVEMRIDDAWVPAGLLKEDPRSKGKWVRRDMPKRYSSVLTVIFQKNDSGGHRYRFVPLHEWHRHNWEYGDPRYIG